MSRQRNVDDFYETLQDLLRYFSDVVSEDPDLQHSPVYLQRANCDEFEAQNKVVSPIKGV